jgi:3-deoxy-7-phosphoheptulonate synthase / chorismate mutase
MKSHVENLLLLREKMSQVNQILMNHLNQFFEISNEIGRVKDKLGLPHFDPQRENAMLREVERKNKGPMPQDVMKRIFKEIFKASVEEMGIETRKRLKVNRLPSSKDMVIEIGGIKIGGEKPVLISGPCSVESYEQMKAIAVKLKEMGIRILRGGAFKPRTSPYSFQGLEEEGLKILKAVADELNMIVVTELLSVKDIPMILKYAHIVQVGTRNMFNYSLLKELGRINKPVFLKRGFMATIDEFILAAEYIYHGGNHQIILCERGIRTFETQTRNTLDISAVPIIKKETCLPIIIDVSHSLGRKDIIKPIAHAALAAGADGLMFESHNNPYQALSDSSQQLDLMETQDLIDYLKKFFQFG